ncbi:unnamed protein product, partial [Scytosiphon promiscuus]
SSFSGEGSGGGGGGGGLGGGINEQRIPEYVPPQKQGSLSKATHRRSSSRTSDGMAGAISAAAEGAAGAAAAGRSGGSGRSGSPPDSSPFFSVRSPPKPLPPVPAFGGGAGGGGGDLFSGTPPPPPPPPPSWRDGQDQDVGAGGGAGDSGISCFDFPPLPPAASAGDSSGLPRNFAQPGGLSPRYGGSPRRRGSGMAVSPVPFPSDRRGANPTTPKQGPQEFPSGGRGSSFLAGPSPDGDNSFSHIDYVASYVAEGKTPLAAAAAAPGAPPPHDGEPPPGGSGAVDPREAFDRQRDERAAISVLPSSPAAWSAEEDVNRGTGVRRRVSPRAAAGRAAAATA